MRRLPAPHASIALLLLAATLLLGCEENLSPRDHFDRPFSVYGTLSPDLDTQSVRVYAIEDFPTLGVPSLGVIVTSKDLATGETRTWTDSVVVDPNGQYEHIFWYPFTAEYGHTYHVEVTRPSDGATSFADVRVPELATVQVDDSRSPHILVMIKGEGIQVLKPEAVYAVRAFDINGTNDTSAVVLAYPFSYWGREKSVAGGWEIDIRMHFDRPWAQSWYNLDAGYLLGEHCKWLALVDFRLHVLVGDSVWNPHDNVFDPNVLSYPTTMSNVQNGFGFIGGGYRIDERLHISQGAIEKTCFAYEPTNPRF